VAREWTTTDGYGDCEGFTPITLSGAPSGYQRKASLGPLHVTIFSCFGEPPECCDAPPPGPDWAKRDCGIPSAHCEWYQGADPITGITPAAYAHTSTGWLPSWVWAKAGHYDEATSGFPPLDRDWYFTDPVQCYLCDTAGAATGGIGTCHAICPVCPFHISNPWTFDPASGKCYRGTGDVFPCPEGTVYDSECNVCRSLDPPQSCWTWVDCAWQRPDTDCPGESFWDWETCQCECPEGQCYYAVTGECVDREDGVDCTGFFAGMDCWWDPNQCLCECCDPGSCYCILTGTCIPCDEDSDGYPQCFAERECAWNAATCVFDCTTPECPEGEEYDLDTCSCVGTDTAIAGEGVDYAICPATGFHYRAYRRSSGAEVRVARSRDGGRTWDAPVTLASDADATAGLGAWPALEVDRWGTVYCWYHTTAPAAQGYYSADGGATFALYATHTGLRYPRPRFRLERLVVTAHVANALNLYESDDGGATLALALTFGTGVPKQRTVMQVDRRDYVHLLWDEGDGDISHRGSRTPGVLASWVQDFITFLGRIPGYAIAVPAAVTVWFAEASAVLSAERSLADYATNDEPCGVPGVDPSMTFKICSPGMAADRYGIYYYLNRESVGNDLFTWGSQTGGETWSLLEDIGGGIS